MEADDSSPSSRKPFVGRSLFAAAAYLNATIDEFRIYDGRLTPAEIATDYRFGPDALALPVRLAPSGTMSGLGLPRPAYAVGFAPQATVALGTAWTNVAAGTFLSNDSWQVPIPVTNAVQFFRLQR